MADVFFSHDASILMKNKNILFIGDSNIRALYKDFLWLLKNNTLIDVNFLKRRLECSFLGDTLLSRSVLSRGRSFEEHRLFKENGTEIEFVFVTRCFCESIEKIFNEIKVKTRKAPDVIVMNSSLWDVCRWGPDGVLKMKENMRKLMLLVSGLPKESMFVWVTGLPPASRTSGGLIIKQIEFIQAALRIHIIEANYFCAHLVSSFGFDVLDFHYYMHHQTKRRSADGIHYLPPALRFLTNLLLTHIALSWDIKLPMNARGHLPLELMLSKANDIEEKEMKPALEKIQGLAKKISATVSEGTPERKRRKRLKKNWRPSRPINNQKGCRDINPSSSFNHLSESNRTGSCYDFSRDVFCYNLSDSKNFGTGDNMTYSNSNSNSLVKNNEETLSNNRRFNVKESRLYPLKDNSYKKSFDYRRGHEFSFSSDVRNRINYEEIWNSQPNYFTLTGRYEPGYGWQKNQFREYQTQEHFSNVDTFRGFNRNHSSVDRHIYIKDHRPRYDEWKGDPWTNNVRHVNRFSSPQAQLLELKQRTDRLLQITNRFYQEMETIGPTRNRRHKSEHWAPYYNRR